MILVYAILFYSLVQIILIIRQYIKHKQKRIYQEKPWRFREDWHNKQEYPNDHGKMDTNPPVFHHPELETPTSKLVACPGEIKETIHDLNTQLTPDDADIIYDEEEQKYIFDCYRTYLDDESNYIDSQIGFHQLYGT